MKDLPSVPLKLHRWSGKVSVQVIEEAKAKALYLHMGCMGSPVLFGWLSNPESVRVTNVLIEVDDVCRFGVPEVVEPDSSGLDIRM